MKLANPPGTYSVGYESQRNRTLEIADAENVKLLRDYEVGAGRIILTAPNGSRWVLTVSNLGVLSATAL
jgi:hypothetical protein